MGRIKSTLIKKAARQLIEGENRFNTDFDHNKKILVEGMPSKSMKNKIAGYIARLKRMQLEAAKEAEKAQQVHTKQEE